MRTQRCTCPSCHQNHALLTAIHVAEDLCAPVGHRQVVLIIPDRLRLHTRYDRKLLGKLCACAEKGACRAFPDPQRDERGCGPKRNFQILAPLEFLVEFKRAHSAEGRAPDWLLRLVVEPSPRPAPQAG